MPASTDTGARRQPVPGDGPPSWVEPELATLTRDPFSSPGWVFERKLDGERCLGFAGCADVRLMSRNRHEIVAELGDAEPLELARPLTAAASSSSVSGCHLA